MIINPTKLADSVMSEIAERANGRFANYRRPWIWAAYDWGLDKYRGQYLQREMDCWQALLDGESVEDAQRLSGVEPSTAREQGVLLGRVGARCKHEDFEETLDGNRCLACGETEEGDAAPSRDDPANDFNYVGSKHHY